MVELLLVIVIMGLMAGVATFSFRTLLPNQALNAAVDSLSDALYGARNEAIARSRKFEMHYEIDEDRFWIETPYRADGTGLVHSDEDARRLVSETDLAQKGVDIVSVTIDEKEYFNGEVEVQFNPLGSTSHHTIVLEHTAFDKTYTIEVFALTGDVRFHQGYWKRSEVDDGDFD